MKLNGAKLVMARYRKGWHQRDVANATGLTSVTISNAETGKSVDPRTGKKICEALEIDLADVVLAEEDGDAA
jgi:transcriptional regulator with XRE-family HTH domain